MSDEHEDVFADDLRVRDHNERVYREIYWPELSDEDFARITGRSLEPVRDHLLIDIGGNLIMGASMTPSEARNCNLELETDGALMEWMRYEEVRKAV